MTENNNRYISMYGDDYNEMVGRKEVYELYEVLLNPKGEVVTTLTEPEDLTFGRDLRYVLEELNRLHEENVRLKKLLEESDDVDDGR